MARWQDAMPVSVCEYVLIGCLEHATRNTHTYTGRAFVEIHDFTCTHAVYCTYPHQQSSLSTVGRVERRSDLTRHSEAQPGAEASLRALQCATPMRALRSMNPSVRCKDTK